MRINKYLAPLTAALLLCGCSEAADVSSSELAQPTEAATSTEKTTEPTTAPATEPAPQEEDLSELTMPVIYINTIDQSPNVMDFVTKPVASHVSEAIASWTPGYKIPPAPYYEDCSIDITHSGTEVLSGAEAKVKVRGNWTTSYDKKPLRINFTEKQSMLGLNGGAEMKNWVLLAEYKDGSMLRNKTVMSIASGLYGDSGLYAADTCLVDVVINGQYWGVYLLTEQQQVNSDRVSITKNPKDYTGTDIGYFMEFDGYYTNEEPLQAFAMDYADNAPLVPFDGNEGSGKTIQCLNTGGWDPKENVGITIKSDINTQEQHDCIESYMNNVYRIMYSAAYEDKAYVMSTDYTELTESPDLTPQQAVENVVDLDSLADAYIINEVACDADIYWSSFFMSADLGPEGNKKLTFQAPWDFDSALGNKKNRCPDGTGFYAANIVPDVNDNYESVNPWLAVLMYEDWFKDIIREKWTSAYDAGVFAIAQQMITDETSAHSVDFDMNYKKWRNLVNNSAIAGELSPASAKCKTHQQAADYLSDWLSARIDFLDQYWHK